MTKRRFRFQSDSSDDDDVRPMTDEEKRQYELKIRARKTGRYHERKRQAEPAAARLDGFSDDVFVRFASYLTAAEMVSLQLSSRAFGLAADGATVVEEAARQLHQSMPMSEYERRVFTKHEGESYVEFYHHFLQFRSPSPLAFRRLIGSGIEYSTESRSCVHVGGEHEVGYRCAIGNQVMRAGRHFAAFEASSISSDSLGFMCYKFGVMRPISNGCAADLARFNPSRIGFSRYIESEIQLGRELLLERRVERWGTGDVHCCAFCEDGHWESTNWQAGGGVSGRRTYRGHHRNIGLLLDLDEGRLLLVDGQRSLVLKQGLTGEYAWFVTIGKGCQVSMHRKAEIPELQDVYDD
ncbi:hypothetical protein THAOC_34028 [Thalassiosira oceanica]|uniref:Uncharacterized protein n=1 Tax=Thalassiosira oceanica TaxID=159749 RepID=K0R369_THAOC|nr:hypothetical protein THAOC_34028 [Thalassiosira oceanica]|eukprot:EJK47268.1 hypothetical protein THAOC_34028 [Thalassiosira oceanica]